MSITFTVGSDGLLRAYNEQGEMVGTESLAEAQEYDSFNRATGLVLLALAEAAQPQEEA